MISLLRVLVPVGSAIFGFVLTLWVLWVRRRSPRLIPAIAFLLLFTVLGTGGGGGIATWIWWLNQHHTEQHCMYIGSGNSDWGVLGDNIYANPNSLPLHPGEHWCGTIEYENGANDPWLVKGGPA